MIRNSHPKREHITIAIDVHTALHVGQDLFAEPPEPDERYDAALRDDEVWKLNKALYGYRKAPKPWHQHVVSVLDSLNYHPLLTDPSCFRNDELNVNAELQLDDAASKSGASAGAGPIRDADGNTSFSADPTGARSPETRYQGSDAVDL